MAKVKRSKKISGKRGGVPLRDLIGGLRKCAETEMAIADLLAGLPDDVLATPVPIKRSGVTHLSISVGSGCRCRAGN